MRVAPEIAAATAVSALRRAGVPEDHAALQADLLLEAELRGRPSHGLLRLERIVARIGNGVADPLARGEHRWHGNLLEVDGRNGLGPVVATAALDAMRARVEEAGVCLAAIRNNNHLGMLAWYAERVARAGHVLIASCTSEALVHPWGGRRAMVGTNPIAIGVPGDPDPFVLDMATSLVSMGQIHDHAGRGEPIPPGWALDAAGEPTTDAAAARDGSIAPFGAAKGYALGLALEVLVPALAGSAIGRDVVGTLDSEHPCNKGDLFILVRNRRDDAAAAGIRHYLDAIRAMEAGVPGDRAAAARRRAAAEGLDLNDDLWARLTRLAAAPAGAI